VFFLSTHDQIGTSTSTLRIESIEVFVAIGFQILKKIKSFKKEQKIGSARFSHTSKVFFNFKIRGFVDGLVYILQAKSEIAQIVTVFLVAWIRLAP
jgi:hypothetical protein